MKARMLLFFLPPSLILIFFALLLKLDGLSLPKKETPSEVQFLQKFAKPTLVSNRTQPSQDPFDFRIIKLELRDGDLTGTFRLTYLGGANCNDFDSDGVEQYWQDPLTAQLIGMTRSFHDQLDGLVGAIPSGTFEILRSTHLPDTSCNPRKNLDYVDIDVAGIKFYWGWPDSIQFEDLPTRFHAPSGGTTMSQPVFEPRWHRLLPGEWIDEEVNLKWCFDVAAVAWEFENFAKLLAESPVQSYISYHDGIYELCRKVSARTSEKKM